MIVRQEARASITADTVFVARVDLTDPLIFCMTATTALPAQDFPHT